VSAKGVNELVRGRDEEVIAKGDDRGARERLDPGLKGEIGSAPASCG
jgi:hypothetical protein